MHAAAIQPQVDQVRVDVVLLLWYPGYPWSAAKAKVSVTRLLSFALQTREQRRP